jgi:hypothetical protein
MVWIALKYPCLGPVCPWTEEENRARSERELGWVQANPEFIASCVQNTTIRRPGERGKKPLPFPIKREQYVIVTSNLVGWKRT